MGRDKGDSLSYDALSGLDIIFSLDPGRCPGLSHFAPVGAYIGESNLLDLLGSSEVGQ